MSSPAAKRLCFASPLHIGGLAASNLQQHGVAAGSPVPARTLLLQEEDEGLAAMIRSPGQASTGCGGGPMSPDFLGLMTWGSPSSHAGGSYDHLTAFLSGQTPPPGVSELGAAATPELVAEAMPELGVEAMPELGVEAMPELGVVTPDAVAALLAAPLMHDAGPEWPAPAPVGLTPDQYVAQRRQLTSGLRAVTHYTPSAVCAAIKPGANLYVYAVGVRHMLSILRAADIAYQTPLPRTPNPEPRPLDSGALLGGSKYRPSAEAILTGSTLLLPVGLSDFQSQGVQGDYVILCCYEGDSWTWDTLHTLGLAVFADCAPYVNTLDAETRLDFLKDDLHGHGAPLVDRNALFLPAVCITPLMGPLGYGDRVFVYADLLGAARPPQCHVPRPGPYETRTPELFLVSMDVRSQLHTKVIAAVTWPSYLHAKALLQAIWLFKDAFLTGQNTRAMNAVCPRRELLRKLHEHLLSGSPSPPPDIQKTRLQEKRAFTTDLVRQHVLPEPRNTPPCALKKLRNLM